MRREKQRNKRSRKRPAGEAQPAVEVSSSRRASIRYILTATCLMGVLYTLYYFPYADGTIPDRAITAYLRVHSMLAGQVIGLFDHTVVVTDTYVGGRFPMQIIKDCSSLDAQALLAAAVLAFRTSLARRLLGVLIGVTVLNVANVLRITALYFIGIHSRENFETVHEELMPLLLIAIATGCFAAWAYLGVRPNLTARATGDIH